MDGRTQTCDYGVPIGDIDWLLSLAAQRASMPIRTGLEFVLVEQGENSDVVIEKRVFSAVARWS